jgi:hypothetical protein
VTHTTGSSVYLTKLRRRWLRSAEKWLWNPSRCVKRTLLPVVKRYLPRIDYQTEITRKPSRVSTAITITLRRVERVRSYRFAGSESAGRTASGRRSALAT